MFPRTGPPRPEVMIDDSLRDVVFSGLVINDDDDDDLPGGEADVTVCRASPETTPTDLIPTPATATSTPGENVVALLLVSLLGRFSAPRVLDRDLSDALDPLAAAIQASVSRNTILNAVSQAAIESPSVRTLVTLAALYERVGGRTTQDRTTHVTLGEAIAERIYETLQRLVTNAVDSETVTGHSISGPIVQMLALRAALQPEGLRSCVDRGVRLFVSHLCGGQISTAWTSRDTCALLCSLQEYPDIVMAFTTFRMH